MAYFKSAPAPKRPLSSVEWRMTRGIRYEKSGVIALFAWICIFREAGVLVLGGSLVFRVFGPTIAGSLCNTSDGITSTLGPRSRWFVS
jgi:hypothetical protein